MELRDLVVTPFVVLVIYTVAYMVRPYVCDAANYRYFFPALTLKIIGAIALGFIYQFYYDGGDTFLYHTYGSRVIWNEFIKNPLDGLALIFFPHEWHSAAVAYTGATNIAFYHDPASYFVVRVAALTDLLTFSSYSATATLFASFSFAGAWMMFLAFYRAYPHLLNWLAMAIFFIPSVFFWGSGILKDTLVMAALGASVLLLQSVLILRRGNMARNVVLLVICLLVIYSTKKYVLLCFVPAAIMLIYLKRLLAIRSVAVRLLLVPALAGLLFVSSYYSVVKIGEGDAKYSLERLALTAQITAYDIGFYTGRDAGSGYSIGTLDGTFQGMLLLAPQAINVSLFRPYLWEVKNPLMLMASIESLVILCLTLFIVFKNPFRFFLAFRDPYVVFCIAFSVTFAFAVGVSTFNFGTLVRYKIPMLPFYVVGLMLIYDSLKRGARLAVETHQAVFEQA